MLERGLLLLALGLGLASTQGTLEEVPVQPGFDAQKVGLVGPALRRYQDRDWTASHGGGAQARGRGWGSAQPVLQKLWWTQEHETQGLPVFSQETEAKRGPRSLQGLDCTSKARAGLRSPPLGDTREQRESLSVPAHPFWGLSTHSQVWELRTQARRGSQSSCRTGPSPAALPGLTEETAWVRLGSGRGRGQQESGIRSERQRIKSRLKVFKKGSHT